MKKREIKRTASTSNRSSYRSSPPETVGNTVKEATANLAASLTLEDGPINDSGEEV